MKSFFKKAVAMGLSALMLAGTSIPAFASADSTDYTISDPYETVDWENWDHYKAMLHTHTLYSDGEMDITDVVEAYYGLDYDVLAITDHGVVNQGWDTVPEMLPLIGYNQYIKKLTPMSAERYAEITNGTDRNGRGMLDVKQGIEMNGVVMRKNHINGYFCGYGQGIWGIEEDYETPVAETEKAGGISVINHPGDFYAAKNDPSRIYDYANLKDWCEIYMKYDSCVGIEVYNEGDTVAMYDRVIWDNILMYTIPHGRVVWAFSNDDSHTESKIGLTAEMFLMPENTNEALRTAMENGTFFACSTISKLEMGDKFRGTGNYAIVNNIEVDNEEDTITVTFDSDELYTDKGVAVTIEWIADGNVIDTFSWNEKQDVYTYTFDLNEHCEDISSYVRFQIKNDGGIVLSQPFVCDDGNMEAYQFDLPEDEDYGKIGNMIYNFILKLRRTILGELIYRSAYLDNI